MKEKIKLELLKHLYMQAPAGIWATLVCALVLSFTLRKVIDGRVILGWLLFTLILAVCRYFLIARFKADENKASRVDYWLRLFTVGIFLSGLTWGSTGVFLFPYDSIPHQVFIAFVLGGLMAGAAGVLSSFMSVFYSFSVPLLAPITVRFFMLNDDIHLAMGIMNCIFTCVLFIIANQVHTTRGKLVELKEEFADLVKARTIQLEETNRDLEKEVAERKKISAALKESEEKYRLLVENAIDTIFIVQDGYIKFHNKRTEELMGYSAGEMATIPFRDHLHPDDRDMVMNRYLRRLKGEDPLSMYSFRVLKKTGEILWGQINAVKINWEGKPAVLCFVRDITEEKKLEEHLQQAQKLESIGLLAGGIAHDFNNILSAIMGNISLAKTALGEDSSCYKVLAQAEEASLRASELTQQLLTFSKGGSPIKKTTSVAEIIRSSVEFALRGSKSKCEYYLPDELWLVEVDPGQINQVIHNLVLNSAQAMPGGGIVTISAENVEVDSTANYPLASGRYIKISVKDEGVGIPEESLQKIFDPYFTTKPEGTGLGLAITYSIVKRHGGYILAKAGTEKGAVFEVFLPASSGKLSLPEKKKLNVPRGSGRILVMDDDKMVRDVVSELLARNGYQVELAENGERALELYAEAHATGVPFDAVILDLTVPGAMGGVETMKHLREIDPGIKAIVSSGYSNDPVMSNYRSYGFRGVMAKPYQVENMIELLNQVLLNEP